MLKIFYANENEIPADVKSFYENRDGGWWLKVDQTGWVERKKLEDFRDNNVTLTNENKTLKEELKKFEGIDPEKYHKLIDREQEITDEKLVKAGKIEEVVAERMKAANAEHGRQIDAKDKRIKELEETSQRTKAQLEKVKIDNVLLAEAQRRGLQSGAETFLLAAARDVWRLDDNGNPVAYDDISAGKVRYGKDGDPIKPGEWMDDLQRTTKFLFKPASGAGSNGGGTTEGAGGVGNDNINPFAKDHWNVQRQMEIYGQDKEKAQRLASAAGVKIGWPVPAAR